MPLNLPPLPSVRDVVKLYRLQAVKQLSQNFIFYGPILDKIVKSAGKIKNCHVVEVGPGPGGITRSILRKTPRHLTVIEKDRRFESVLEMLAESYAMVNGKMDIVMGDILRMDLSNFLNKDLKKDWNDHCPDMHIIGNLPFNISTPLIIKWLHAISEKRNAWEMGRVKMTLTFQKEVAERLVAETNSDQRCRLSVMAQTYTEPQLQCIIPGKYFIPEPKVDVGVVTFTPHIQPRTNHEFKLFEKITRHIFSSRQKYSIKCVSTLFPPENRDSLGPLMFQLANLKKEIRPYVLTVEEIDRLVSAYKYICEKHPDIMKYNYRASRRVVPPKFTNDVVIMDVEDEDKMLLEE